MPPPPSAVALPPRPPLPIRPSPVTTTTPTGCLCDKCSALCCRYFALPLDNPTTARDYDNIRWYLMHDHVVVYIEKKQWYLAVLTKCKNLQPNNLCGIYETRPRICREYTTDNCDYHGGEYDFQQFFHSAEELEAYAKTKLAKKRRRTIIKRKFDRAGALKIELPVVG